MQIFTNRRFVPVARFAKKIQYPTVQYPTPGGEAHTLRLAQPTHYVPPPAFLNLRFNVVCGACGLNLRFCETCGLPRRGIDEDLYLYNTLHSPRRLPPTRLLLQRITNLLSPHAVGYWTCEGVCVQLVTHTLRFLRSMRRLYDLAQCPYKSSICKAGGNLYLANPPHAAFPLG